MVRSGFSSGKVIVDPGEGHITISPLSYSAIVQGTWNWAVIGAQNNPFGTAGQAFANIVTHAINDEMDFKVYLAAGSYTILLYTLTAASQGIVHVQIDGADVTTIDLYANPGGNNQRMSNTFVNSVSGIKTLGLKIASKNGASSDYQFHYNMIVLWRTA